MQTRIQRRRFWPGFALGVAACLGLCLLWQVLPRPALAQTSSSSDAKVASFNAGQQRNTMIKELRGVAKQLDATNKLLAELRDGQKRMIAAGG